MKKNENCDQLPIFKFVFVYFIENEKNRSLCALFCTVNSFPGISLLAEFMSLVFRCFIIIFFVILASLKFRRFFLIVFVFSLLNLIVIVNARLACGIFILLSHTSTARDTNTLKITEIKDSRLSKPNEFIKDIEDPSSLSQCFHLMRVNCAESRACSIFSILFVYSPVPSIFKTKK